MKNLLRLFRSLRPYYPQVTLLVTCVLVVTAASLVTPGLIQNVIDAGLTKGDSSVIAWAGGLIVLVGLVRALFNFGKRYVAEWLINHTGFDFRNMLYAKLQSLPFGYHDTAQTGQLMSRCTEDVGALSRFVGQAAVELLNIGLLMLGILVLLVRASPTLTLLSLGPIVLLVFVTLLLGRIMTPMFLFIDQALGDVSSAVQENLTGVQVVRAFAREQFEKVKFATANRKLWMARVRMVSTWGFFMPSMTLLVMASTGLVLWFGGRMVIAGTLTLGELAAFNAYLLLLGGPTQQLGFVVNAAGEAVAGAQRIFEILDLPEEIRTPAAPKPLTAVRGQVTFEHVSFGYRDSRRTLHDVSFEARPNQIIALIGPTGSGKTSLINLIPRFYDVTAGAVRIDGQDVRQVDLKTLRRQIGLVLQTSLLFSTTIRENIAFGRVGASQEEVLAAARAARAHDFIEALPAGYETVVGERGVTLSGGQRQRLAIARALLMNPRILILDDATSSVDTQTEHLIQQALDTLMQDRTTFVIAQRLSTVRRADLILVLDAGQVVQRGVHTDLVAQPGLYQEIYNLQLKDQEQFQREMLFLDLPPETTSPPAAVEPAARPDLLVPQLRPSSVK